MASWEEAGRKYSWSSWRRYFRIYESGLKKTSKNLVLNFYYTNLSHGTLLHEILISKYFFSVLLYGTYFLRLYN